MNIHEYQAKQLLKSNGVSILSGDIAHTPDEAKSVAKSIGGKTWVVKAQIHAGGRGKGGGVKLAHSLDEVETLSHQIIGMNLITAQTGPSGKTVQKVYIEQGCQIQKEYYIGIIVNHTKGQVTITASDQGGMNIEQVAAQMPEKIYNIHIDTCMGLMPFQARQLAFKMNLHFSQAAQLLKNLYDAFIYFDGTLLEINPLVLTKEGQLIVLDAKMSFDDNALYRHPDILQLRDTTEEDPAELEASKYNLAFIKLDGQIACPCQWCGASYGHYGYYQASWWRTC